MLDGLKAGVVAYVVFLFFAYVYAAYISETDIAAVLMDVIIYVYFVGLGYGLHIVKDKVGPPMAIMAAGVGAIVIAGIFNKGQYFFVMVPLLVAYLVGFWVYFKRAG